MPALMPAPILGLTLGLMLGLTLGLMLGLMLRLMRAPRSQCSRGHAATAAALAQSLKLDFDWGA
jgi:hypothetical protein